MPRSPPTGGLGPRRSSSPAGAAGEDEVEVHAPQVGAGGGGGRDLLGRRGTRSQTGAEAGAEAGAVWAVAVARC